MAKKKLKGIIWPNLPNDTYILDAGEVEYNESDTFADATVGKELQNKANIDGSYSDLTAGNAEQLISNVRTEDKTPYLFRTSGGSVDIGDREFVNGIVGGTVAWNQLVLNGNFSSTSNWNASSATFTVSNSVATIATSANYGRIAQQLASGYIYNHVYFLGGFFKADASNAGKGVRFGVADNTTANAKWQFCTLSTAWQNPTHVFKATYDINGYFYIQSNNNTVTFDATNVMLVDLTQMFGSTIADYIYSLETANAGAGVAWFKKLFNKPYYAYNAGELKSVSGLVSHDMTGFNQLDISEGYKSTYFSINGTTLTNTKTDTRTSPQWSVQLMKGNKPVYVPWLNTTTSGNRVMMTFTASATIEADTLRLKHDGSTLDLPIFSVPFSTIVKGATYCLSLTLDKGNPSVVGGFVISDICLNLSWDGSRDGEYEPYELHSYPLDTDLTLRGIPKLDANNSLYYDGDVYAPSGEVTRKYGIEDLGIRTWERSAVSDFYVFTSNALSDKALNYNFICQKYVNANTYRTYLTTDKTCGTYNSTNGATRICIRDDAYTDVESFVSSLDGVYLVYELATPTTETADPYTTPQIVNDFGTEEYVIDSNTFAVPVGHNTDYPINLVAKLEMAPNSPEGNGDYIVRQVNGENSYVPLVIEDALPTIPSTAGSYKLTVTVAEGSDPVLSWEAE